MIRLCIIAALSLALGAIVNVAAAWWCTIRVDTWAGANEMIDGTSYDEEFNVQWWVHVLHFDGVSIVSAEGFGMRLRGDPPEHSAEEVLPYWAHDIRLNRTIAPGTLEAIGVQAAGWPWRALSSTVRSPFATRTGPEPVWPVSVPAWVRGSSAVAGTRSGLVQLPLRPVWPGFAGNTLLYGLAAFTLITATRSVRRARRRRRGRCVDCGYPAGTSPVCTECGAPLPRARQRIIAKRRPMP